MILEKIAAQRRIRVQEAKERLPLSRLRDRAQALAEAEKGDLSPFLVKGKGLQLIGEIKKASPSKGLIRPEFDPAALARAYTENQVNAISVLTESDFFQGKNEDLQQVRQATHLPLLRKDFVVDAYQLYEAKCLGANCVLLIAALLDGKSLQACLTLCRELRLHGLVEVHTLPELYQALEADPSLIGINNRDLKTFETRLETTARLIKEIPAGKIVVSESGIHSREQMVYLESLQVDGVLIGEALMRAPFLGEKLKELRGEQK